MCVYVEHVCVCMCVFVNGYIQDVCGGGEDACMHTCTHVYIGISKG